MISRLKTIAFLVEIELQCATGGLSASGCATRALERHWQRAASGTRTQTLGIKRFKPDSLFRRFRFRRDTTGGKRDRLKAELRTSASDTTSRYWFTEEAPKW